ncbi:GL17819 [Drosophila persimilis]|uniref:GL17819 n=1 Tax=Drosophila persimilis TaxID=7234 RepID=B4H2B7_DROPE|nr:GL17819 [Drosophila persimilis]
MSLSGRKLFGGSTVSSIKAKYWEEALGGASGGRLSCNCRAAMRRSRSKGPRTSGSPLIAASSKRLWVKQTYAYEYECVAEGALIQSGY